MTHRRSSTREKKWDAISYFYIILATLIYRLLDVRWLNWMAIAIAIAFAFKFLNCFAFFSSNFFALHTNYYLSTVTTVTDTYKLNGTHVNEMVSFALYNFAWHMAKQVNALISFQSQVNQASIDVCLFSGRLNRKNIALQRIKERFTNNHRSCHRCCYCNHFPLIVLLVIKNIKTRKQIYRCMLGYHNL